MTPKDIIMYEGNNSTFIWKHSCEDFTYSKQLIVNESQEAILYVSGQALDLYGEGQYNFDDIKRSLSLAEDDFKHCELYFINKEVLMEVGWGVNNKVRFMDPTLGADVEVGVSGEMDLQVVDSKKLLIKLLETMKEIAWNDNDENFSKSLQDSFRPLIATEVKTHLVSCIQDGNIKALEMDGSRKVLEKMLKERIEADLEEYGLSITEVNTLDISLSVEDPETKKMVPRTYSTIIEIDPSFDYDKKPRKADDKTQKEINENEEKRKNEMENIPQPEHNTEASTIDKFLKRVEIFLENQEWKKAKEYCDKALDLDPENQYAYEYLLYADLKVRNEMELERNVGRCVTPFDNTKAYKKAVIFARPELAERLKAYNDQIRAQKVAALFQHQLAKRKVEESEKRCNEVKKEMEYYQGIVKNTEEKVKKKEEKVNEEKKYALDSKRLISDYKKYVWANIICLMVGILYGLMFLLYIAEQSVAAGIILLASGLIYFIACLVLGWAVVWVDDQGWGARFGFAIGACIPSFCFLAFLFHIMGIFFHRKELRDLKKRILDAKQNLPQYTKELEESRQELQEYENLLKKEETLLNEVIKANEDAKREYYSKSVQSEYPWRYRD